MPNPLFSCAQMPHKSLFCRLLLLAAECGLYLVFLFEVTFVSVSLHCPYKTVHRVDKLLLAFVAHFVLLLARFHKRHFLVLHTPCIANRVQKCRRGIRFERSQAKKITI